MSGANTFSGNLIVNNGTLAYNANLPTHSYTINGGTLNTSALSLRSLRSRSRAVRPPAAAC